MFSARCEQTVTSRKQNPVRQNLADKIAVELHNLGANGILSLIVVSREGDEQGDNEQRNAEGTLPALGLSSVQRLVYRRARCRMRTVARNSSLANRNPFDAPEQEGQENSEVRRV